MVSHSPKPLTFYDNTKILNVHTVFNFTNLGKRFIINYLAFLQLDVSGTMPNLTRGACGEANVRVCFRL